jgi:site-specific recombinase XerC
MASFFQHKNSGFYYLKVKRGGKWVQVPTNIRVEHVDSLRRVKMMALQESAKELEIPRGSSGWEWVPGFLRTQFGEVSTTLQRYGEAWTALEIYIALKECLGPERVTHTLCYEYCDWRVSCREHGMRPVKWNTALHELKVFSRILSEAVKRGMIQANPCFRLGLRRRNTRVKPEITHEEQAIIEEALKNQPQWMQDSWTIAMCQGFRLSETNCPLSRVEFGLGTISVIGKGHKVHTAPLHPKVREIALRAKQAKQERLLDRFPHKASLHWVKFFRSIGMSHLSFHCTRVTVVTRLARSGASKAQTMAYVGHASETVHEVYLRLSAPDVAHLGKLLDAGVTK